MRNPKHLVIALLVFVLAATGTWMARQRVAMIDLQNRAMAAEERVAGRDAEKARLQKIVEELRERIAKLEAAPVATTAPDAAERKATRHEAKVAEKLAARTMAPLADDRRDGAMETWLATSGDAEVVRRLNEQARLQTLRHYGAWLDQLGLAPAQREQLERLLTDKRQVPVDVAAATFQAGKDPRDDPAEYRDLIAATRADLEQQIHALLGDAGYESYQQYDHVSGQAQVINRLGQLLTQSQQPLSPAQRAQLQASMQANDTGRITAKVVTDAKSFLSPIQLQALRDLRALQQANSQKRNTPVPVLPATPGGG